MPVMFLLAKLIQPLLNKRNTALLSTYCCVEAPVYGRDRRSVCDFPNSSSSS